MYKLKQNSPWTQYFTENNQTYTIKQHMDSFTWGEMMGLALMYLGRFFSILPLDEIFKQSIFSRNIRKHQPFDYSPDTTLSVEDPRPIKDQSVQNVIAHWAPKFIINAMYDLVTDENENKLGESKIHTLTYKQPDSVIAPTIARQLESYYGMKQ